MLDFNCDYHNGCAKEILDAMYKVNDNRDGVYGDDFYSKRAKAKILEACENPDGEVWFLAGGTQTNKVAIAGLLKPYESVVCCNTGHINFHEAGAIEATGHKVMLVPNHDGKLDLDELDNFLSPYFRDENIDHMVLPKMVYISNPTEYGTLYTKEELISLRQICDKYQMYLYLDGARLGYALTSDKTLTLPFLASVCDAFYIGGTKCGALFGEALVLKKKNMIPHFFTIIKQQGALLAKSRTIGIQFDTLFTDNLYLRICENAIKQADLLRNKLKELGYSLYKETITNQIFLSLPNELLTKLKENIIYSFWELDGPNKTVIRLATTFDTKESDVLELVKHFN